MKLRYYLRGLGIGIAVTALIMGFSANGKTSAMTDEQVKARARELGMVDGVLSEIVETEDADPGEAGEEDPGQNSEDTDAEQESEEASGGQEDESVQPEASSDGEEAGESGEEAEAGGGQDESAAQPVQESSITVVAVYPGEGSHTISRKLANMGLVESADIFDDFLCQNGYDKKLGAGNYEIPEGAGAQEIAEILTGSR